MSGYFTRIYPAERAVGGSTKGLVNYVAAAVGPHATVVRWTLTAPSGVAFHLEHLYFTFTRDAASPGAAQSAAIIYNNTGGDYARAYDYSLALGTQYLFFIPDVGWLTPGEQAACQTADAAAGGSHTFVLGLHYRGILV